MSKLHIFFLDVMNNIQEEKNINKPISYQDLLKQIEHEFKNLPENIQIFYLSENNQEIDIDDEQQYKLMIDDIIFIRVIDINMAQKTVFERNYNILPKNKQNILDEKYNCTFCLEIIKNENPYLCYQCQNLYHEKCLKGWDKKCKSHNQNLTCPNCRNPLPIEKWGKKLNYEQNRKEDASLINEINDYKLDINMNKNIINIKDKKIKELKMDIAKQNELIKKYEEYIDKTIGIFKNLLDNIYSMNILIKIENNNNLKNAINKYSLNKNNLDINNISIIITEELEKLKNYIINNNHIDNNLNIHNDYDINEKNIFENNMEQNNQNNEKINLNDNINIFNDGIKFDNIINNDFNSINENMNKKDNDSLNKIIITYNVKSNGYYNLFGNEFVSNNLDNIELIINGKKNILFNKFELKKGNNIIELIIINKLTNLSHMFYKCDSLNDINGLKYLDVTDVEDFSHMFKACSSLSDIKSLENWDVSNGTNFKSMFCGCYLLKDIKPLQKWNLSNCINLSNMFDEC